MLLRDLIREYTQSRAELPPAPPARPVPQTHVCPKCKTETLINIKYGKVTIIKEPDAKTQSR